MWRGMISIVALLIIIGSLIIIIPILIIPNTFLYQFVPVLKPLHQALACTSGETMEYEHTYVDGSEDTHYRCVDTAGNKRNVDDKLLTPANYALGTLCLGVLLMFVPLYIAVRRGLRGETSPELQAALQQSYDQFRQIPTAMTQTNTSSLSASGKQQLDALDKLRQGGLISTDAYETARQHIFDHFSLSQDE
ncbi:MAG: hypothetical protein ABI690_31855 [Chloroflexota bacterium]